MFIRTVQKIYLPKADKNVYFFLGVSVFLLVCRDCCGLAKFTNMQCQSLNENFSEICQCRLRAVKRDVNELSFRLKILPSAHSRKDILMRWQLLKKASGYKPFLYDISVDLCDYLEKRNHPFLNIIFKTFVNNTAGFNRCPLNHDIALNNFQFPSEALVTIPLPMGDYALFGSFAIGGQEAVILKLYFNIADF